MLCSQNGERIVVVDFVTSFHPLYTDSAIRYALPAFCIAASCLHIMLRHRPSEYGVPVCAQSDLTGGSTGAKSHIPDCIVSSDPV